jgi:hypothetical protein
MLHPSLQGPDVRDDRSVPGRPVARSVSWPLVARVGRGSVHGPGTGSIQRGVHLPRPRRPLRPRGRRAHRAVDLAVLPIDGLVVPASTHENRTTGLMLDHLTEQGVADRLEPVLVDRGVTAAAVRALTGRQDRTRCRMDPPTADATLRPRTNRSRLPPGSRTRRPDARPTTDPRPRVPRRRT